MLLAVKKAQCTLHAVMAGEYELQLLKGNKNSERMSPCMLHMPKIIYSPYLKEFKIAEFQCMLFLNESFVKQNSNAELGILCYLQ